MLVAVGLPGCGVQGFRGEVAVLTESFPSYEAAGDYAGRLIFLFVGYEWRRLHNQNADGTGPARRSVDRFHGDSGKRTAGDLKIRIYSDNSVRIDYGIVEDPSDDAEGAWIRAMAINAAPEGMTLYEPGYPKRTPIARPAIVPERPKYPRCRVVAYPEDC